MGRTRNTEISLKEHFDSRLRDQEKAVEAALAALNRAATKDDAKISLVLSAVALLVAIGTFIFLVRK